MPKLAMKKTEIDNSEERLLCTGLIISDAVLRDLSEILTESMLTAPYTRHIAKWCLGYYKQYKSAPRSHIQALFENARRNHLDEDTADLISDLLADLSDQLVDDDANGQPFNEKFVLEEAEKYIKKRTATMLCEDTLAYLSQGNILEAESGLARYQIPSRLVSAGVDVFEPEFWQNDEESAPILFNYRGVLDHLVGPVMRDSFISFLAAEKVGKCIVHGQRVLLSSGQWKNIEDVVADRDDNVISFDENTQSFVVGKITDWFDNGQKPVIRVLFKSGRVIETTTNHPFLTPNGWKQIGEIGVGGFVANPKEIKTFGKLKMDEHKIRLLAYFIADGCLCHKNEVLFSKGDRQTQLDFLNCIALMGDATTKINKNDFRVIKSQKSNTNHTLDLLIETGLMGKKSRTKTIPKCVFDLDKKSMALFLNILFSCDGWATKREIGIGFSNESLIRDVQLLLLNFGIIGKIRYRNESDSWVLSILSGIEKASFFDQIGVSFTKGERASTFVDDWRSLPNKSFIDRIPADIGKKYINDCFNAGLTKKFHTLKRQIEKNEPTMRQSWLPFADVNSVGKMLDSPIFWDEIVSFENIGNKQTYDLTIDEYHNFVVEGCIVHNTWWLLETALTAFRQGCNVAFFSVGDMTEQQIRNRMRHMLTRCDPKKDHETVMMPVVDCYYNLIGQCPIDEPTDPVMADGEFLFEKYGECENHKTCTKCRKTKYNQGNFLGRTWLVERDAIDFRVPLNKATKNILHRSHNSKFSLFTFPPNTVSVHQIKMHLDVLRVRGGNVQPPPDVIVIDYADLLDKEPNAGKLEYRHQINNTWMALRALSQELNCAVITATQAKIEVRQKGVVEQWDTSEDKRKLAHVTAMLALNQTNEDKKMGTMRISNLATRDSAFDVKRQVVVSQCLESGRPYIDSFWYKSDPVDTRPKKRK